MWLHGNGLLFSFKCSSAWKWLRPALGHIFVKEPVIQPSQLWSRSQLRCVISSAVFPEVAQFAGWSRRPRSES